MKRASVSETKNNLSGLLHAPDAAAAGLVRQGLAAAPRVLLDVERLLQARLPRLPEGISASRLVAAERANDG